MGLQHRLNYYRRILPAYLTSRRSHLTFWHDTPELNARVSPGDLGEYYMPFAQKADYVGPYDSAGIPLLDYQGATGRQYNPIAIAQYGLGNFNLFRKTQSPERKRNFLLVADWLVTNLEKNIAGLWVWNHHFDWEYRTKLQAPWYSGLAQSQGISVLVRAYRESGRDVYLDSAERAFQTFLKTTDEGGVTHIDDDGSIWFEEYVVRPPTHILNGFIWASWGVYDYGLATADLEAKRLFSASVETLKRNLAMYDVGFWSLYEQSGTRLKMLASPFYHSLHITQLRVLHNLTREQIFARYADKWESYCSSFVKRNRALMHKSIFKLLYY